VDNYTIAFPGPGKEIKEVTLQKVDSKIFDLDRI
jgi:hypothetical protein